MNGLNVRDSTHSIFVAEIMKHVTSMVRKKTGFERYPAIFQDLTFSILMALEPLNSSTRTFHRRTTDIVARGIAAWDLCRIGYNGVTHISLIHNLHTRNNHTRLHYPTTSASPSPSIPTPAQSTLRRALQYPRQSTWG